MLSGIPALKPYANQHIHELDFFKDIYEFKSFSNGFYEGKIRFQMFTFIVATSAVRISHCCIYLV